jgi:hypothetical protein
MEGCDVYVFHAEYVALMQAGIVMSMKSRCEPKIVWVKSKDKQ